MDTCYTIELTSRIQGSSNRNNRVTEGITPSECFGLRRMPQSVAFWRLECMAFWSGPP